MTSPESEMTAVLETTDQKIKESCSLVLAATGIDHNTKTLDDKFIITVNHHDAQRAKYHLDCYTEENLNWPPPSVNIRETESSAQPPTLLIIGALALFYGVTGPWSTHSEWFRLGAGDATAILESGQYYRLVTALTLHADITHLMGNCFLGGFVLHFLFRSTGTGLGVFATLVAATLGNYINVAAHGGDHHFVGFSTAVFSCIGILAMLSYSINRRFSGYHFLMPFMAGAAMLAMTGSSGERTDLGAHFFGLLCGFGIGGLLILPVMIKVRSSTKLQLILLAISAITIYQSWQQAFFKVY